MSGGDAQAAGTERRLWALLGEGDVEAAEPLLRAKLRAQDRAGAEVVWARVARVPGLSLARRLRLAALLGWCPPCALLPAGAYWRGLDGGERAIERPAHRVTLTQGVWLGLSAVTQAQWRSIMNNNPSKYKGDGERAVEQVSWYEAAAYCEALSARLGLPGAYHLAGRAGGDPGAAQGVAVARWRSAFYAEVRWEVGVQGARLPTEGEWEYAASAGDRACVPPPWEALATWCGPLDSALPSATRAAPANRWGLYDLLGGVGEWCWDWMASYEGFSETDPTGPARQVLQRVVRGGGRQPTGYPYPQRRLSMAPSHCSDRVGLRVAFTDDSVQ
jgi:formylglycine-generating enzyme required for sulfatase activity